MQADAANQGQPARTLMLSPRAFVRDLYRCSQIECEDVIASVEDVQLLAPRPLARGTGRVMRKANRIANRLAHAELLVFPGRERIKLERDYDLFVFYARDKDDLKFLQLVPGWRDRCRQAVCIYEELWWDDLQYTKELAPLQKFDVVGTQFHHSLEVMHRLTKRAPLYLPAAVDALRFFPGVPGPRRSIDIFGMGRRVETMHQRLMEHAREEGLTYLFDTIDPIRVRDGLREHRVQLAEMIKRSRYFVVNRAKVDMEAYGGAVDEVGHRSFEGAAGGAVLIGHTPTGEIAKALFDWPDAHFHVQRDSSEFVDLMHELDRDPERVRRIRQNSVSNVLRRHDWSHRWRSVLEALALPLPAKLQRRLALLDQLAVDFTQSDAAIAAAE